MLRQTNLFNCCEHKLESRSALEQERGEIEGDKYMNVKVGDTHCGAVSANTNMNTNGTKSDFFLTEDI